jgi:hypothetical protein
VVPAALDREQKVAFTCEPDGRLHVSSAQRLDYQGRSLADHPVPDGDGFVEPGVGRAQHAPVQLRGESGQRLSPKLDRPAVEPGDLE